MHAPVHDVEAGRPDPGRRGPSRRRSSQLEALVETGRRLSKAHAPSQPEAGGASLERKFADMIKRIMREDVGELAAVQAFVRAWRQDNFDQLSEHEQNKKYTAICS